MKSNDNLECIKTNYLLGRFPQYIIYHFNKDNVRRYLVESTLNKFKKNDEFTYLGTFHLKEKDKTKKPEKKTDRKVEKQKQEKQQQKQEKQQQQKDEKQQTKQKQAEKQQQAEKQPNQRFQQEKEQQKQEKQDKEKKNNELIFVKYSDYSIWKKLLPQHKKSYYFSKKITNFLKENRQLFSKKKILFTVCLHYNLRNVHYVSFVYDYSKKFLVSFDAGVMLYPEGQDIIVKGIIDSFQKANLLMKTTELGSSCYKYRYHFKNEKIGIQYNIEDKDAWCQSWSLYFLIEKIKNNDIIEKVCKTYPYNREIYLMENFIIPILKQNEKYIYEIVLDLCISKEVTVDPEKVIEYLQNYTKYCQRKICSKQEALQQGFNGDCNVNLIKDQGEKKILNAIINSKGQITIPKKNKNNKSLVEKQQQKIKKVTT
jgi:flagellar motor protein MotB